MKAYEVNFNKLGKYCDTWTSIKSEQLIYYYKI